jgi:hypothetical protein
VEAARADVRFVDVQVLVPDGDHLNFVVHAVQRKTLQNYPFCVVEAVLPPIGNPQQLELSMISFKDSLVFAESTVQAESIAPPP